MDFFAPEITAQGYGNNTNGRTDALQKAINADRARPANCYSLAWKGALEEVILLVLKNIRAKNRDALMLRNNQYLGLNDKLGEGALYELEGERGRMRRATIHEFSAGGSRIRILQRTSLDNVGFCLVYIDFGTPTSLTLKIPLYAGVSGASQTLLSSESEAVLRMEDGEAVDVFYADGRVTNLRLDAGKLSATSFHKEEALTTRLSLIEKRLADVREWSDELTIWYRELGHMLQLTKNFSKARAKIVGQIEKSAKEASIPSGAAAYLRQVLVDLGDTTIYEWLAGSNVVEMTTTAASEFPLESPQQYDARLHGFITDAMSLGSVAAWDKACMQLVAASAEGQLRPGVHKRFMLQCPSEFVLMRAEVSGLKIAVSTDQASFGNSPLRGKVKQEKVKPPLHVQKAEQRQKQLDRAGSQPKRQATGQKQDHYGPGKHQRKGSKKK